MKQRWWKYLLLALVDVEANYTVVKAYQYTTLTSVQVGISHFLYLFCVKNKFVQFKSVHCDYFLSFNAFLCMCFNNHVYIHSFVWVSFTFKLLDCFVIPVVMILSWWVLKTRYRLVHYVAVCICLLGVGAMVGADLLTGRDQGSSK